MAAGHHSAKRGGGPAGAQAPGVAWVAPEADGPNLSPIPHPVSVRPDRGIRTAGLCPTAIPESSPPGLRFDKRLRRGFTRSVSDSRVGPFIRVQGRASRPLCVIRHRSLGALWPARCAELWAPAADLLFRQPSARFTSSVRDFRMARRPSRPPNHCGFEEAWLAALTRLPPWAGGCARHIQFRRTGRSGWVTKHELPGSRRPRSGDLQPNLGRSGGLLETRRSPAWPRAFGFQIALTLLLGPAWSLASQHKLAASCPFFSARDRSDLGRFSERPEVLKKKISGGRPTAFGP